MWDKNYVVGLRFSGISTAYIDVYSLERMRLEKLISRFPVSNDDIRRLKHRYGVLGVTFFVASFVILILMFSVPLGQTFWLILGLFGLFLSIDIYYLFMIFYIEKLIPPIVAMPKENNILVVYLTGEAREYSLHGELVRKFMFDADLGRDLLGMLRKASLSIALTIFVIIDVSHILLPIIFDYLRIEMSGLYMLFLILFLSIPAFLHYFVVDAKITNLRIPKLRSNTGEIAIPTYRGFKLFLRIYRDSRIVEEIPIPMGILGSIAGIAISPDIVFIWGTKRLVIYRRLGEIMNIKKIKFVYDAVISARSILILSIARKGLRFLNVLYKYFPKADVSERVMVLKDAATFLGVVENRVYIATKSRIMSIRY